MNLMGIDIGTTGCKAAVFNPAGQMVASAYREYAVIREFPGQAELNAHEIWDKVMQTVSECTSQVKDIHALSATSMGEAVVPIDRDGQIVGPSVLGTDTRGVKYIDQLAKRIRPAEVYAITGQPLGMGYTLPNLCRIRDEEPEIYRKTYRYLPWADFVSYRLTGEMTANYSLASRTLLFDPQRGSWSSQMVDTAGIDLGKLPPLAASGHPLGLVCRSMSQKLGIPKNTQVVVGSHDQCAATLGAGVSEPSAAMLGLGTYACMVLVHKQFAGKSPFRQMGLNIEPHALPGQFVSFIYHGSGGSLIQWIRNEMFRDLQGDEVYPRMFAELNQARHPTVVLPYFAETGPLDFAAGGQGVIADLSLSHSRADVLKAVLEGIIYYFKRAMDKLRADGRPIQRLVATGGGAESALWRQMIADILKVPVSKPHVKECGTLGAAIIAGSGTGCYSSITTAIDNLVRIEVEHLPEINRIKDYTSMAKRYCWLRDALIQ